MPQAGRPSGVAGGIIGLITASIGMIWSIANIALIDELNANLVTVSYGPKLGVFSFASMFLAVFLIISCVLIGVAFHGVYLEGGGAMGKVGRIFGIMGSILGALLIILGIFIKRMIYFINLNFFQYLLLLPGLTMTLGPAPTFSNIGIGIMIIAVTFIMLGATSIALRKNMTNSSGSVAAGIFSIASGCFLFPYILYVLGNNILFQHIDLLGSELAFIGFGLTFVAFLLWAVVFYAPGHITIFGEVEALPSVKSAPESIIINCLHCGSEIPEYADFCPHCGEVRARCTVCQKDIISGDQFLECPHCHALSHKDHLLEWIRIRGACPSCKKKLRETDIV